MENTIKQSLKRALTQEFLEKTTDEAVKRLRSSIIPEFKAEVSKICFEANNEILEKINQAISSTENGTVEKFQETLENGKKLIRITDREEDGLGCN